MSEQTAAQALPFEPFHRGVFYIGALDGDGEIPVFAIDASGSIVAEARALPETYPEECEKLWALLRASEAPAA